MNGENNINESGFYASGIKLPKQDNYEIAYKEAVRELVKRDLNDIALKSGAKIICEDTSSYIVIPFINEDIIVTHPDVSVRYSDKDTEVQLWLKILLLHYLIHAKGTPAYGEEISFKQVTGGLAYYPAFQKRSIEPILKSFGNNLNDFAAAAEGIGGVRRGGAYSVSFQVFPMVSVTFNIWEGDEELPADGNVVFDSSISDYLSTEDIAVLCNILAVMIIKKGKFIVK